MEVEKRITANFLSFQKHGYGGIAAFFIIGACFIMSNFYWDSSQYYSTYLNASWDLVVNKGEYWRLFTTSFIHGDLDHLLSNTLMLFVLTYFVTSFYGIWASLILSFTLGTVINFVTLSQYSPETTLVGASGIVYYLWGFWLVLFVCIEKRMSLIRRIVRVMAIFFVLLIPTTYSPSTSYLAHYFGFIIGGLSGSLFYFVRYGHISKFEKWEYRIISPPSKKEIEDFQLNPKDYPKTLD